MRFFLYGAVFVFFALSFLAVALPADANHTCNTPTTMPENGLIACYPQTEAPNNHPCGCTVCHVFATLHRIVQFLTFQIALPLAVLLFVVAGFMLLISGANPQLRESGKKMLTTAVIGLLIVLLSWVIINTIINVLGGGPKPLGFPNPWNEPICLPK